MNRGRTGAVVMSWASMGEVLFGAAADRAGEGTLPRRVQGIDYFEGSHLALEINGAERLGAAINHSTVGVDPNRFR